jgi:glycogen operon protein
MLFDGAGGAPANRVISLDPGEHRTGHYWHVRLPGVQAGQRYGYRMRGPSAPDAGDLFDPDKLLLDPYGKGVDDSGYRRSAAVGAGDNQSVAMKSVVADLGAYDWEDDRAPRHPFSRTIIYEMHVGGFTRHPTSGVSAEKRGTYAGMVEKLPYLVDLGVTAVELMPVFAFDAQNAPTGLENYWGYAPVSFFAPHLAYSSRRDPLACLDEFRDMVKAFHRAGIEVILDVVYNHTAEGGENGATLSFKGLDNRIYYTLSPDRCRYVDYTGTGNTLNANASIVRRLILDSLRYWVSEMHVDGFRFDLASVLSRDEHGQPVPNPPVLSDIDSDPALAQVKLIAEAWDAAGLYQVGSFSGDRWKEWNGRFRDDMRAFIKGDNGTVANLGQRLLGSPDLYAQGSHPPEQSINFATCHDGFTLNDLVSFDHQHNEANLENNRDGTSNNLSWNCGVEGPTEDPGVEALRSRQIRNALALTVLSLGTPLLLMGDEVRRTQGGNNNAYCQNNETSWFDWDLCSKNADLYRYVRLLIKIRKHLSDVSNSGILTLAEFLEEAKIEWHAAQLGAPDLSDGSHSLAATAYAEDGGALNLMLNAYWEPLRFVLPPSHLAGNGRWCQIVDTARETPYDIPEDLSNVTVEGSYMVQPRSIVLLANIPDG